jgi:hypothetical protein
MKFGTKVIWGLGVGRYAQAGVNSCFFLEDCRCVRRNFSSPGLNLNSKGSVSVADKNCELLFYFYFFNFISWWLQEECDGWYVCFSKLPRRFCFRVLLAMSSVSSWAIDKRRVEYTGSQSCYMLARRLSHIFGCLLFCVDYHPRTLFFLIWAGM